MTGLKGTSQDEVPMEREGMSREKGYQKVRVGRKSQGRVTTFRHCHHESRTIFERQ